MSHRKTKLLSDDSKRRSAQPPTRAAHSLAEQIAPPQSSVAPREEVAPISPLEGVWWMQACGMAKDQPIAIIERWKELAPDCDAVRPADIAVPFFDHARYTQLRHELSAEWQPQNHVERMFVDQLARGFTAYMHWHQIALDDRGTHLADVPFSNRRQRVDQARRMAESTYGHVLSTLKSMRELRG